jgi:hypothetical protein
MGDPVDNPSFWYRVALPVGFCAALAWLVVQLWGIEGMDLAEWALYAGPLLVGATAISVALHVTRAMSSDDEELRPRRWDEAVLAPCVLAPLAVIVPWAAVPTHLGPGLGGFSTFLAWLTRYPTMGPVNHEVLLGLFAVLGSCAMPAFLAVYASQARQPRFPVVATLALLHLLAYVPVLLRLDVELAATAWALGSLETDPVLRLAGFVSFAASSLLRLAATVSVLAFTARTLRASPRLVVWESL